MTSAGKHTMFKGPMKKIGCHVLMRMTAETGLSATFMFKNNSKTICAAGKTLTIDWGDGSAPSVTTYTSATSDVSMSHTYPSYGDYNMVLTGVCQSIGFSVLDSSTYTYSKAPISIIDYSGVVFESSSGALKSAVNLETLILPWVVACGQRDFAYCTKLKTVELGCPSIYYDGVFQGCTALESFKVNYDVLLPRWQEIFTTWTDQTLANRAAQCWHNVWNGCSSIKELNLGHVRQFGNTCFSGCSQLTDIYVTNHTAAEIKANFNASSGNFPSGAAATVKFHGTDGYVLGDGTIVT